MNGTAEELVLDRNGICNFCHQAQKELRAIKKDKKNLSKYIRKIKQDGAGKEYDCIIGLSGGVDSSYLLHEAIKLGLRPFVFTVDNGWQTDRAQENIMKLVEGIPVRFYRYTIDLKRFAKLQSAFIRAGQKNIEIPTDHILMAATYEMASRYGIKWILSGGNVATESIMPPSWGYNARDLVHIKSVYQWAWQEKLKGLPLCSLWKFNWYKWIRGIRVFYPLDYLDYDRNEASKILSKEYDWNEYGQKHEENLFTWWFQSYYLFEKFGIDKRTAHFSSLINSGQMTRKEAMSELVKDMYYPPIKIATGSYKPRPYNSFRTDEKLYALIGKIVKTFR